MPARLPFKFVMRNSSRSSDTLKVGKKHKFTELSLGDIVCLDLFLQEQKGSVPGFVTPKLVNFTKMLQN